MITGEHSAEIAAAQDEVFRVLADVEAYPQWQSTVKEVTVLRSDDDGRPLLVESRNDAKVKTLCLVLRYEYDVPRRIAWRYEDGDVKDITGSYELEAMGAGACRVTYRLSVDPGRRLGLLLRGPLVDQVRNHIMRGTLEDLQRHVGG